MPTPRTTQAAVMVKALTTEIRELPIPEIKEDDALLRLEISGICSADWQLYNNAKRTPGS